MESCQNCGTVNEDNSKFCQSYGKDLNNQQEGSHQKTPMRCTLCGNKGTQNFYKDEGVLEKYCSFDRPIKIVLMTCNHCGHIEMFNESRFEINFD